MGEMNPSLVIRVPESKCPVRTAFEKVLDLGEFQEASDPDWPEFKGESTKYEQGDKAPGVRINLYRDELVPGRHGRYTFEFVGENERAVTKVRDEFNATLASHNLHAPK
jgi:hypothetical protein